MSILWSLIHLGRGPSLIPYRNLVVKIIITIHWWCNPSNRKCILKHRKIPSQFETIASQVQRSNHSRRKRNIIMRLNAIELLFHFRCFVMCDAAECVFVWLSAGHRVYSVFIQLYVCGQDNAVFNFWCGLCFFPANISHSAMTHFVWKFWKMVFGNFQICIVLFGEGGGVDWSKCWAK